MKCHQIITLALFVAHYSIEAQPAGEHGLSATLQARFGDTITELEWLLNQLVNILTEMTDSIEQDPGLLNNARFRPILVQVIRRIDYILEHFENSGPEVLTPQVQRELTRIDCVRIRLANYISQTRRFDDRACRRMNNNMQMILQGGNQQNGLDYSGKPNNQGGKNNNNNNKNNNNNNNNYNNNKDQIMPLLTQIVSLLVQILNRLNSISAMSGNRPAVTGGDIRPVTIDMRPTQRPWTASTINWDEMMGMTTTQGGGSGPNWDAVFGSTTERPYLPNENNGTATPNWNDLINQVMEQMGSSLQPAMGMATTPATTGTTAWEDAVNELINQWNQSVSRPRRALPDPIEWNAVHSMIADVKRSMPELAIPN